MVAAANDATTIAAKIVPIVGPVFDEKIQIY